MMLKLELEREPLEPLEPLGLGIRLEMELGWELEQEASWPL